MSTGKQDTLRRRRPGLTDGQKTARAAVRAAAREIIRKVDELDWRKECIEFGADFHLSCIRYDKATYMGSPCGMSMPVYSGHIVRRARSSVAEGG